MGNKQRIEKLENQLNKSTRGNHFPGHVVFDDEDVRQKCPDCRSMTDAQFDAYWRRKDVSLVRIIDNLHKDDEEIA